MIWFKVEGEAVAKGRPKFVANGKFVRAYTPKKTVDYENKVKKAFLNAYQEDLFHNDEPLRMEVTVYKEIPKSYSKKKVEQIKKGLIGFTSKPDLDNIVKSISDALNGLAFKDDSQIVEIMACKEYSTSESCVWVKIDKAKRCKDVEDK